MTNGPKKYTRLHAHILQMGVVILDLSRKTGIHERTLHYYLKGLRPIPRRHAEDLAKVLGVPPRLVEDTRRYTLEPMVVLAADSAKSVVV